MKRNTGKGQSDFDPAEERRQIKRAHDKGRMWSPDKPEGEVVEDDAEKDPSAAMSAGGIGYIGEGADGLSAAQTSASCA